MPSCNLRIAVTTFFGTSYLFSKGNHSTFPSIASNAFLRSTNRRKTPESFPVILRKHSRTRRTTKRPSADPCSGRNPTCVSGTSLSDRYLSALLSNKACILDAMLRSTIPRQLFQSLRAPFLLYKGIRIASNHDVGISSPFQSL